MILKTKTDYSSLLMTLMDCPKLRNLQIGTKSFSITLATSVKDANICIMLTGYPEKFKRLYDHNPSVNRIFHTHELKELSDEDIKIFTQIYFFI